MQNQSLYIAVFGTMCHYKKKKKRISIIVRAVEWLTL